MSNKFQLLLQKNSEIIEHETPFSMGFTHGYSSSIPPGFSFCGKIHQILMIGREKRFLCPIKFQLLHQKNPGGIKLE
jgi:hypothetical protein